jgi:hypothetical protein
MSISVARRSDGRNFSAAYEEKLTCALWWKCSWRKSGESAFHSAFVVVGPRDLY